MFRELVARVGRVQRLAVFEAAGRLGSFTAAAAELGMTQPAVTRQIRQLEATLRFDLFRRTANRSELTEAGRALLRQVSIGFSTIEAAIGDLSTHGDVFVLACNPGLAQQWLVPRLGQLQEALDGHELRLWLFNRDDELATGPFDAAIRVGDGNFSGVDSRLVFPESVFPVATPALAAKLSLKRKSKPKDLLSAPLLHMDDGDRPWMSWAKWFNSFGVNLPRRSGRVLFNNYPMVLQQAVAGHGVALGWRYLVDDLIDDGVLVPVGPEVASDRGYYVTWPESSPSQTVRALTEWLVAQADQRAR